MQKELEQVLDVTSMDKEAGSCQLLKKQKK